MLIPREEKVDEEKQVADLQEKYCILTENNSIIWYNCVVKRRWYQNKQIFRFFTGILFLSDLVLLGLSVYVSVGIRIEWPLIEVVLGMVAIVVSKYFYYPYCFLSRYYVSNYWNDRICSLWNIFPMCYGILVIGLLDSWFFLATRTSMWSHLFVTLFISKNGDSRPPCLPIASNPSMLPGEKKTMILGYVICFSLFLVILCILPLHAFSCHVHRRNSRSISSSHGKSHNNRKRRTGENKASRGAYHSSPIVLNADSMDNNDISVSGNCLELSDKNQKEEQNKPEDNCLGYSRQYSIEGGSSDQTHYPKGKAKDDGIEYEVLPDLSGMSQTKALGEIRAKNNSNIPSTKRNDHDGNNFETLPTLNLTLKK